MTRTLSLLFGAAVCLAAGGTYASERGRAYIANNTVVAKNGWALRGENPCMHCASRYSDPQYFTRLRESYHLNTVRVLCYREPQNTKYGYFVTSQAATDACESNAFCQVVAKSGADYCQCTTCGSSCQCTGVYQTGITDCPPSQYSRDASATDFDFDHDGALSDDERAQYVQFVNEQVVPHLDRWVATAAENGFYVIIDYHPVGGHDPLDAMEWWKIIAPRYKDRSHVIYELMNEPSLNFTANYPDSLIAFIEKLFWAVRQRAPETLIIAWSFAGGRVGMLASVQRAETNQVQDIDYSNAAVAFHPYNYSLAEIQSLHDHYPVIASEIGDRPGYPNEYNHRTALMEQEGISWVVLDGTEGNPLTDSDHLTDITWEIDPGDEQDDVCTQAFTDVGELHWARDDIYTLLHAEITAGCGQHPLRYCPDESVSRAAAAVLLLRAKHGSTYEPPAAEGIFSDVELSDWAAPWAEQLFREEITRGCGDGLFCPDRPLTRAMAAALLLRAKHGSMYEPPPAEGLFSDVELSNWAAPWVEQLFREGITVGCDATHTLFCPDKAVTRAAMAVLLVRAFQLEDNCAEVFRAPTSSSLPGPVDRQSLDGGCSSSGASSPHRSAMWVVLLVGLLGIRQRSMCKRSG